MIALDAVVDDRAHVAESARIWGLAQVREDASVGENCIIGRGAYIDAGVKVGANCKIQNSALVYAPAVLEDGVFIGPAVILTNDTFPRAIKPDGSINHDFTGKLSFSWPATAGQSAVNRGDGQTPLFGYGYGLTYADAGEVPSLPE